jgi:predicted ester cyclase
MNLETANSLVAPFYDALNRPATKDVAGLVYGSTTDDWRSFAREGMSKGREEFIQQVIGFGKLIPDLTWGIQETLVGGDRIVVRSQASGTPAGDFFGVPHTGRTFQIMTIDIHTVRDGQLAAAHHVEDWATAMRQLSAK